MRRLCSYKNIGRGLLAGAIVCLLLISLCERVVTLSAKGAVYDDPEAIPGRQVGLLLGTLPLSRYTGGVNLFCTYRIDAVMELYEAGKLARLLISGDGHSFQGIDETAWMKQALLNRGFPEELIVCDTLGLRTLDSVYRAKVVYGLPGFCVISQQFHNERALYLARQFGYSSGEVIGYNAKSPVSPMAMLTYLREGLARVKLFLDLLLGVKPKV